MKTLPITMSSSIFSELRRNMTTVIQDTLLKMEEVGSNTGKISVSIGITCDEMPVTGEKDYRTAKVPKFKFKVGYKVPIEDGVDGEFGGEYELVKEDGDISLKLLDNQTSMFDDDDEDEEDEEEDDEE